MDAKTFKQGLRALSLSFRQQSRPRSFDPTPVLEAHPGLREAVADLLIRSVATIAAGQEPDSALSVLTEGVAPRAVYTLFRRLSVPIAPVKFIMIGEDTPRAPLAQELGVAPVAIEALWLSAFDDEVELRDYHRQLLTRGSFTFPDHQTGQPRAVSASLLVLVEGPVRARPMNFYVATGSDGFLCLEQSLVGGLAALFIPSKNLFIGTPRQVSAVPVVLLRAYMLASAALTARALQDGRRQIALLFGGCEHIGHTMLNEYSALDHSARTGLLDKVRLTLRGWVGFLPPATFLPELQDRPVLSLATEAESYHHVVKHRLLVVRPSRGRMWISPGLVERLHALDTAARSPSDGHQGPTIWFEVRSNDRLWSGQQEGFTRVANALAADWPGLRIVLSGWSQPGDAAPREYDTNAIARDRAIVEAIRAELDPVIEVVDITGHSTLEKLHWARRVDAYAAGYSSGFIFPHAIGRKPGVLFCNTHFSGKLLSGEHPELIDLQPFPVPLFMLERALISVDVGKEEEWDANFDFDWRRLHEAMDWLLRQAGKSQHESYGNLPDFLRRLSFHHTATERAV